MTPKEKAEELVGKFYDYVNCWDNDGNANYKQAELYAKECALIAVDEILNLEPPELSYMEQFSKSWWQEVKQEIEKL